LILYFIAPVQVIRVLNALCPDFDSLCPDFEKVSAEVAPNLVSFHYLLNTKFTSMRKLVGLIVCSALLFSCGNDPKTAESTEAKAGSGSSPAESKDYEFADVKIC